MAHIDEWRTSAFNEACDEWSYPTKVFIDGKAHKIRNNCDYRVILDCISALNDVDLSDDEKVKCALYIFYDDLSLINDIETAVEEMFLIISGGKNDCKKNDDIRLMDWEHDFPFVVPPINRTLGYDVRNPTKFTHWYSFLGGYMEIGECTFSTVVSIRSKRAKGKPLDKWEREYLSEHRQMVELPKKMTEEEKELLVAEW